MSAANPIFKSRRLGHVNLFVDDLDRSTQFYNGVCGLALEFRQTGLKASFLGTGHTPHDVGVIETTKGKDRYGNDGLIRLPKHIGTKIGLNHLAWEVENEVELVEGYKRARAHNIAIQHLADYRIARSVYVNDPDGNSVEFYVDTVREWRKVVQGDLDVPALDWNPEASPPFVDHRYDLDPELRHVPDAQFHPLRLSHVVLATQDVPRLASFYEEVAGLDRVFKSADGNVILMRGQYTAVAYHLGIVKAPHGEGAGLHHFALELGEATRQSDLARLNPPAELQIDTSAKTSTFVKDPDGFLVEFFATKPGAQRPDLTGNAPVSFLI